MKGKIWALLFTALYYGAANAACGTAFEASTPLLNTAVHDLSGFGYVHGALEKIQGANPGSEICVTGLVLSKDIYQYGQYYIQADVRSKMDRGVLYRIRFLFQDASTQAFQNMNRQPWTVVDVNTVDEIIRQATRNLKFQPLAAAPQDSESRSIDWLALARGSRTYAAHAADGDTMMSVPVPNVPGLKHAHLVSWLTKMDGNIFADVQQTKGVVVGFDENGASLVAENLWLYESLTSPLQTNLQARAPRVGDDLITELLKAASSTAQEFLALFSTQIFKSRF